MLLIDAENAIPRAKLPHIGRRLNGVPGKEVAGVAKAQHPCNSVFGLASQVRGAKSCARVSNN
jgi:hypothetical protein